MFSEKQKRYIADEVQKILRNPKSQNSLNYEVSQVLGSLNHPEMPKHGIKFDLKVDGEKDGEYQFLLHVDGAESWSWADIRNNGAVQNPNSNPFSEMIATKNLPELPTD